MNEHFTFKTKNKNKNNKKRTFHWIQVKPPGLNFPLKKKKKLDSPETNQNLYGRFNT